MIPSPYAEEALKGCFRVGDSGRWKVNLDADLHRIAGRAAEIVSAEPIVLNIKMRSDAKGVTHYVSGDIETDLILRATYRRLVRQYRIELPSREAIVCGIIEAVSEASPFLVTRCDIRSFYESLDVQSIVSGIVADTRTSPDLRRVLQRLYTMSGGPLHLAPRGLAVSTVFAELALREFDQLVRKLPGVHRYFRYADDVLVFSMPGCSVLRPIEQYLSGIGLSLNKKTASVLVKSETGQSNSGPQSEKFDFLGYTYCLNNRVQNCKSREFEVSISEQKLKKRQTRATISIRAFLKNGDARLLLDRLMYLTSNHSIYRTKHTRGAPREKVRTGIYYNYTHCGHYRPSSAGRRRHAHQASELVRLDGYLHALLFGKNSKFGAAVAVLSPAEIAQLRALSFAQGYKAKIMRRFTRARVAQICRVWGHD